MEPFTIRTMLPGDEALLERVDADVFDEVLEPAHLRDYLETPGHFLAVAVIADRVVGMATAVLYKNPDKPPELWINELGVAPAHCNRGIGSALIARMLEVARDGGCEQAWVLTDESNGPANRVYSRAGSSALRTQQVMYELRFTADV